MAPRELQEKHKPHTSTSGIAPLAELADAGLRLATEYQHLIRVLAAWGLIDDHAHAVLTVRLNQLEAFAADLRARRAGDSKCVATTVSLSSVNGADLERPGSSRPGNFDNHGW